MKRYITTIGMVILLIFCFTTGDALAGKRLLDNFSGTYMDAEKWQDREFVREVAGGKLVSKLGNAPGSGNRNRTRFQNPEGINKIVCTIVMVDVKTDTGSAPYSFVRIGGTFYSVQSSGGSTGDIWAEIQIGDRGSGLGAFWEIWRSLNDDFSDEVSIASGTLIPPGTLLTATPYLVELEYTNEHDIIFRVAGQSATFPDAGWQSPPVFLHKELATGIGTETNLVGASGIGYVSALFDDVFINDEAQAYDNFNSAFIDPSKWFDQESVREISNGKLRINVRNCNPAGNSESQGEAVYSFPVNFDRRYIEAKMLIKSGTQIPAGKIGHARFGTWYYNDSRGPGSGNGYNGNEGNVWVAIMLQEFASGQPEACAQLWRSDEVSTTGQDLLFECFPTAISYDTEYKLSIDFRDSTIIFKCNELAPIIYNVQTPMYEPSGDFAGFNSRVYTDPGQCGYMKATFDDVYLFAPAIELSPTTIKAIEP